MKKQTKIIEEHTHHHFHWDSFMKMLAVFLLSLILLVTVLGWVSSYLMEDRVMYSNCLDACSKKHFSGLKVGLDKADHNCNVLEYDRTGCIQSCNMLIIEGMV